MKWGVRRSKEELASLRKRREKHLALDREYKEDLRLNKEKALPNAENVIADGRKFTEYLFNPNNEKGYSKGKYIRDHLGYDEKNWRKFRNQILKAAKEYPVENEGHNGFGDRYLQHVIFPGLKGIYTELGIAWIEKEGQTCLVTVIPHPPKKKQ